MSLLFEASIPRAIDAVVARFSNADWKGARLEAWLFEDVAARREAEAALAGFGVQARLRSALKPLVHEFLDNGLPPGPIRLPCHADAASERFVLEAYPLAALMAVPPVFVSGDALLDYVLGDGSRVLAPNRVRIDAHGRRQLACCGWLRVWRGGRLEIDERLETEFETVFDAVIACAARHAWPAAGPLFPTLHIEITTGGICRPLGVAHECIDTREALHEDLYFSLIELFQARAGLPPGARTLHPGQIVPDIRVSEGPTTVRVAVIEALPEPSALGPVAIDTAARALDLAQVDAEMARLGGEAFTARSVKGRTIHGLHRRGSLPGIVVTAGQHANETSGVVGLLRAAPELLAVAEANVALVPLENPDGYAVHRHLCAFNPRHMHHAAR